MIKKYTAIVAGFLIAAFAITCGDKSQTNGSESNSAEEQMSPLDSVNQKILESPNDPELYKRRAQLLVLNDSLQSAMDDLDRALRIDSTQDEVIQMQGDIYYSERRIKQAQEAYNKCTELNPENTGCLLKLAEIQFLLENFERAITLTNEALQIDEQIPEAYALKGDIYAATGDSALAASSFQTSIELDPNFYDGYIMLGLLYGEAGSDLALEYYNTALDLKPQSVEALYNKAYYLQTTGFRESSRYEQAIDLYNQIEEIDETNATANFNKGFIYLEYYQEYQKALDEFSEAIEKYPGYFQAFYNRGLSLEGLGRMKAARNDYQKALAIEPTYTPAALALERLNRNLGD